MCCRNRCSYCSSGFTLIELMITLALLALIVTLSIVQSSFLRKSVVRSEVNQLSAACSYLQQVAMTTGEQQMLVIDLLNNAYSFKKQLHVLDACCCFDVVPGSCGPPSSPRKPIHKACSFKNNTIVFYPDGVISSGVLYVTDSKKQTMYALSNGIANVSHLRMYRYDGGWELLQ